MHNALLQGAANQLTPQGKEHEMRRLHGYVREGKIGWILLWLLGIPIPILILLFLIRGCT